MAGLPGPATKAGTAAMAMATGSVSSATMPETANTTVATGTTSPGTKEDMFAKFQPWVLATYGDSAKTKTITTRKAARIRALLSLSEKVGGNGFCCSFWPLSGSSGNRVW